MATFFLIIIYISFISLGLPDSLLGVSWPLIQPEYHVPFGYAGFISMIISSGTIISSLLSGRVLRRFGTGRVTFISVLMTAAALMLFAFSKSFSWLLFIAVPLGIGAGAVDAGLNVYVARHYKSYHMNWLHCFWGVGAMSGPVIMSQYIENSGSWRKGYFTVSVFQFLLVVLLLISLPLWDRVKEETPERTDESTAIKQKSAAVPNNFLYPLKVKGVKIALISFLFYCGIEATMGLWGSSFLIKTKGLGTASAARWVSLFYGSITFGRLISGFATMRFSNKVLIRTGEIVIMTGALFLLLPLSSIFSLVGFILIGLGCAPIYPCMLHETPARFGRENAQEIMGFQMAVAYTGTTLLPPAFGFAVSNTNMEILPFFILSYIIIMLVSSEKLNFFVKEKQRL